MDETAEQITKLLQESQSIVDSANSGNWFPASIVGLASLTLFIVLSAYIKLYVKMNNSKHKESEDTHKENGELLKTLGDIVIRLESNDENKGREIGEIKTDVRDIRKKIDK